MLLLLICSYLLLTVSFNFDLTSIRKSLKHSKINNYYDLDYTIPSWAYKNAFNHNKKYNKITRKLLEKNQTRQEQKKICKFYGIPFVELDLD